MTAYVPGAISSSLLLVEEENSSKKKTKKTADIVDDLFSRPKPNETIVKRSDSKPSSNKKLKKGEDEEKNNVEKTTDDDEEEEEAAAHESENSEQLARTIFVGNVPVKADTGDGMEAEEEEEKSAKAMRKLEKELRKEFTQYGKIDSIRFRSVGVKSVKVPTGSDYHLVRKVAVAKGSLDDRIETCNAYIVFASKDSVFTAVDKADSMLFHGNHLRVDAVRQGSKGRVFDRNRTVFVGNLVFEASEEECRAHFEATLGAEAVKSVRIVRDPATNLGRGFGYVLLKDESLVHEAINRLNNSKLRKREIRVTKCERSSSKKDEKNAKKRSEKPSSAEEEEHIMKNQSRRKKATLAQQKASSSRKFNRKSES